MITREEIINECRWRSYADFDGERNWYSAIADMLERDGRQWSEEAVDEAIKAYYSHTPDPRAKGKTQLHALMCLAFEAADKVRREGR